LVFKKIRFKQKMIKDFLRKKYNNAPEKVKKTIKFFYNWLDFIPFTFPHRKHFWLKNTYQKFARDQRNYIFLSIARFLNINRPIEGYYFEFGSCGANTMRMAWDAFHYLFDFTYVAFDSFEGFPEISEIDKQEIFEKGKAKMTEEDFIKTVIKHGIPRNKIITIKGFYDKILNHELKEKLSYKNKKAAVIYIDCDLYYSTIPVLDFIKDFLQTGTIIVFDDWNCFFGDPERGEKKAFSEFRAKNPDLIFEDFIQTNEAKSFIFLGRKK